MKTQAEMVAEFLAKKEVKKIEPISTPDKEQYFFNKSRQTRLERDVKMEVGKNYARMNGERMLNVHALQTINEFRLGDKELLLKLKNKYQIAKCDYFTNKNGGKVLRYCFNGIRVTEKKAREIVNG